MNINQLNTIGTGMMFPIKLTTIVDEEGNVQKVPKVIFDEDGNPKPVMEQKYDNEGNPIWLIPPTYKPDGTIDDTHPSVPLMIPVMVDAISWRPISSQDLIKQNLISIMTYMIGQRFRQENFGCRIWECLEEPNTQAINFLIYQFVSQSIAAWEPRITSIDTELVSKGSSLNIILRYRLVNTPITELNFEYNLLDNTSYGY